MNQNEVHIRPRPNGKWDIVLEQHSDFMPSDIKLLDTVSDPNEGHEHAERHRAVLVFHPREDAKITAEQIWEDYTR